MLATEHTLDPEALYTINAAGFSATADAFARDRSGSGNLNRGISGIAA